jgi:hypothetical protein
MVKTRSVIPVAMPRSVVVGVDAIESGPRGVVVVFVMFGALDAVLSEEPLEFKHRGYAVFPEATASSVADLYLRAQVDRWPTDRGGGPHGLKL